MKFLIVCSLAVLALSSATELTPDNWDQETAGKTVFIKFFAPWCGHCKKMKPAWDKLMEVVEIPHVLVADVDCIGSGKSICSEVGVKGFPTIKFGDITNLQDYKEGRDFDSLKSFVDKLKPICSPKTLDLCSEEERESIEAIMLLSADELETKIAEMEQQLQSAEESFKEKVDKLKENFENMHKEKEELIASIKSDGNLGLLKTVAASINKDEL